jgi:hypothetical protein
MAHPAHPGTTGLQFKLAHCFSGLKILASSRVRVKKIEFQKSFGSIADSILQGRIHLALNPKNDWDATDADSVVVKLFFEDELCMLVS